MTDNTQANHLPEEFEQAQAEHRLPNELDMAVRRARGRQPHPDAIVQCMRSAQGLSDTAVSAPRFPLTRTRLAGRIALAGSLAAAAAAVYLLVTWNPSSVSPERDRLPVAALSQPIYSPITQVSLVEVGYRRIEADLEQAQTQLAQASEAIALSAVRLEVQQSLEEFYDWSDPGE